MSAATLLERAALAKVALELVDGRIKASGDAGAIAALADQIIACKAELLQRLAVTEPLDPLAWLRSFVGGDTVPVAAIRAAASDAGVPWASVEALKADYIIDRKSLGRDYWKFARFEF